MSRTYLYEIDSVIRKPDLLKHRKAVFILHDQLNLKAWPSWIGKQKPLLIFIESGGKGGEILYHKVKATYVLSAMRHFALECFQLGFPVLYHSTKAHFDDGLNNLLKEYTGKLFYMTPSEWDTRKRLKKIKKQYLEKIVEIENGFFFADAGEWADKIGHGYRMEFFYREMRKRTGYLMSGDKPEGGEWNYDDQNRKPLPKNHPVKKVGQIEPDEITIEVMEMVKSYFPNHFGSLESFHYAVSRNQALNLLDQFVTERLDDFGPYEDALKTGNHTLFHSQLSLYLNSGLLLPNEVCERALEAYRKGNVKLQSVEGFVRQILGWREYIRVYYEAMMPDVRNANHFGFTESLPEMYWTGKIDLKCMSESLTPVIAEGYSHHIQRLMILSNFSNLTETDPRNLNRWFRIAYADAYEWVVLPNVLGMSTFADGGILASKPYVSSGNYINKMSDYCKNCHYNVTDKTGSRACPFNYLYWNFVDRQRDTFNDSGRVNFMVNMFDNKKSDDEKEAIRTFSRNFLEQLKRYE